MIKESQTHHFFLKETPPSGNLMSGFSFTLIILVSWYKLRPSLSEAVSERSCLSHKFYNLNSMADPDPSSLHQPDLHPHLMAFPPCSVQTFHISMFLSLFKDTCSAFRFHIERTVYGKLLFSCSLTPQHSAKDNWVLLVIELAFTLFSLPK